MKIAYILPSLANRGPIKVVYELVEQLKNIHDIDIYYFNEQNDLDFDVPTHHIGFFEPIEFNNYDIIHSHGIRPDTYVYLHNKKISTAKTITTLHNYVKEDLSYQYNILIGFIFSRVWNHVTTKHNKVITLSQHAKQYYLEFWYNKQIDYVYNGIPKKATLLPLDYRVHDKVVYLKNRYTLLGSIGLLTQRKGFEQIIKALPLLQEYALVVIGNGKEEANLKALCKTLDVENRVLFLGFQSNVTAIIALMDIIVVPSRSEGFSLVIQEAAQQNKPVICSNLPAFNELFSEREIAFFTLDDIQELILKIKIITHNYGYFSSNIHKKFLTTYTSKVMAKKYQNYYNNLLEVK